MVTISLVSCDDDLEAIRLLQRENLFKYIDSEEAAKEVFVTAEYTYDFLKLMNDGSPSIIAKDGDILVGYALVARKESVFGKFHPLLDDLYTEIDKTAYQISDNEEIVLGNESYVYMGQVCVKKGYRSNGLLQDMYAYYRDCYSNTFQYVVTDVARTNMRSVKAHMKRGFKVLRSIELVGKTFEIIIWDWRKE